MICAGLPATSQDRELSALIADIVEAVADKTGEGEEPDLEQLIDHFTYLAEHPLNINAADKTELAQLMTLTEFQIFSLHEYIREYGSLMSVAELLLVSGFDENTVSCIKPFVAALPVEAPVKPDFRKMTAKGRSALLVRNVLRVEKARGYSENSGQHYLGSPAGMLVRYRYKYRNNLQIGLTADKDAGEEFFGGHNRYGFDFYSFHLMLGDMQHLKKLIVGDFKAHFGQGLNVWRGFAMGKTTDPHSVKRQNNGFSAYSSADELTFFRGIASTLSFGSIEISPFLSYRKIDATMADGGYTSLSANGLHRTPNEMARKNTLPETVAGINLAFAKTFWRIGTTCLFGQYEGDDRREVKPYNMFELHRATNAGFSLDWTCMMKAVSLFGEAAISSNGGKALIAGLSADINSFTQLSAVYRNYQKNYQAVYSNAFGENGKTANEQGMYLGFSISPDMKWKISSYFDLFSFPWLRYGINSPSSGQDFLLQTNYTPGNDFDFHVRLQYDRSMKNLSGSDSAVSSVQNAGRIKLQLNAVYALSPELSLSSRVAATLFEPELQTSERGYLMYQDVKYKFQKFPLTLSARYALFSTDSWNTRLYAFESDILYAFSVPAYYDKGCRYYLNISWKILTNIQLWLRLSQTRFFERQEIGSGMSAIKGNKQTDVKIQMQIKL
ncbi:MAG: helix-hairpin-helix domain-containing protein [Prevotellaceae bacterium]|nr:helix-hairpin-helix domain-containing protein [Prevotellaceae bacterium]